MQKVAGLCLLALIGLVHASEVRAGTFAPGLAGFRETDIGGSWNGPVSVHFGPGNRMYVVERAGRVFIVENGARVATPLLNISHEVGGWRDYGLLGFALHPSFPTVPYVYVLYVVDHYALLNIPPTWNGDPATLPPAYSFTTDEYFQATIGRIARYTADAATDFRTVVPGSRKVLLGETPATGFPILHQSHGTGALLFGSDGTLLAISGDGASYNSTDEGSAGETYFQQALNDGIIGPDQNIGALRSQYLRSLAGKLLRLDPETGDGLPSNPWWDSAQPRSVRSRAWAMGLRNPYRFDRKPGTGSPDPTDANPGLLFVGDVGWGAAEDLHVIDRGGLNLGWPIFEGQDTRYPGAVGNPMAPNPLYDGVSCTRPYFQFNELVKQEARTNPPKDVPPYPFPNPCDASQRIPDELTSFHTRPPIAWRGQAWASTFNGAGAATKTTLGTAGVPIAGASFSGNASTGGVFYVGTDFPPAFQPGWVDPVNPARRIVSYFHADYGGGWIRRFLWDDTSGRLVGVEPFLSGEPVVFVATHPVDGGLYYVKWGESGAGRVRRIEYDPSANLAPTAVASPLTASGPGPLTVAFSSAGSADPEGQPLVFAWDFDDGTTSTAANPTKTFTPGTSAPTRYDVRLRVTDSVGNWAETIVGVSVNNSPPQVTITSPAAGTLYAMTADETYPLRATIADAEHSLSDLSCEWQVALHHDSHTHPEPVDTRCQTTMITSPAGCSGGDHGGGSVFFWRAQLTVRDPEGLATTRAVDLHPDCAGAQPHPDLSVAASAIPSPARVGLPVTYSIAVTNNGTGSSTGVVLRFTLPPAAVFSSSTPGPPECVLAGDTLECALGTIADGATRTVSVVATQPAAGTVAAVATVTSESRERNPLNSRATVSVTVIENSPPTANPQAVSTPEDVALAITLSGSDPDGDALTYEVASTPTNGTLSGAGPSRTYTPAPGFSGSDSFTFVVRDTGGATSFPATVSITVTPVNDAPTANPQAVSTPEDVALAITLSGSDPDGDALTYEVASTPTNGTLSGTGPSRTYTPAPGFSGSDSFTFVVRDTGGATSFPATVSITVTPVNDAPTANPQAVSTPEDVALAITLSGSDPDGDTLTYEGVSNPTNGTLSGTGPSRTYTPTPGFWGSDSFTFHVTDPSGATSLPATVSITVTPVNDPPSANPQAVSTPEDVALAITLSGSDPDGDTLTYEGVSNPTNGTLSGTGPSRTYTPTPGFWGSDSFTFRVKDPGGATSPTATVSITVTPVNDPPSANPQAVSTPEDVALAITLSGSDPDGDTLTYAVVSPPTNGTLSGTGPSLTYTPALGFSGSDSFTFRVTDPSGATSAPATVSATVVDVPTEWVSQDIGGPALAGSLAISGSTFTVTGGGSRIGSTADKFHYVYQPLIGDGQLEARVISLLNTNSQAKAGVMIRESLAAGSRHATAYVTPVAKTRFIRRSNTNGTSSQTTAVRRAFPYRVRIVRRGTTIEGYTSPDGVTWSLASSATLLMGTTVYIGLAVTAQDDTRLTTVVFDEVRLSTGASTGRVSLGIGDVPAR